MTVKEVSRLTGVSVRALQYYDRIGLLPPARRSEAGYRLYDAGDLERLQQILLFRELGFPLRDIRRILSSSDYDRHRALRQQIELLTLRREHIENLIALARELYENGGNPMDFKAFDTKKMDEYAEKAKQTWGGTAQYREYEKKTGKKSAAEMKASGEKLMAIFADFGRLKEQDPAGPEAQAQVRTLQAFITENYYTCTDEILSQLGNMYAAGGEFTENIDAAGGAGTAAFADRAIQIYCKKSSVRNP